MRRQYKKNKFQIIALTWNDESELPLNQIFKIILTISQKSVINESSHSYLHQQD